MSDLIDREALRREIYKDMAIEDNKRVVQLLQAIMDAPSVDAEPVQHGRWVPVDGEAPCDEWDCSACGRRMTFMVDMDENDMAETYWRCPKCGAYMCGAKMGGAEDDRQGT